MNTTIKNKKGFTLTELIIVMAVIAILAAVMIPSLIGYVKKANQSKHDQEAQAVANELNNYLTQLEAGLLELPIVGGEVTVDNQFEQGFKAYYLDITNETLVYKSITVSEDGTVNILLEDKREAYTGYKIPANLYSTYKDMIKFTTVA